MSYRIGFTLCVAVVVGCSGGEATPDSVGGGGSASGGAAGFGGAALGGAGGTAAGGSGGSGGSTLAQAELVFKTDCELYGLGVFDTKSIYYTCKGQPAAYTGTPEWKLYRVLPGSAPEFLASAPNPLRPMTIDTDALYVYFAKDFDDVNTWNVAVRRVPLDAPALNEFAPELNPNAQPTLLAQTAGDMFLVHAGKVITRHPKPAGGFAYFATDADPVIKGGWTDETSVGWVTDYAVGPATAYQVPIAGGALQKGFDFPDLCFNYFHDPVDGGWVATCAKAKTSTVLDVLRFDSAGTMSVVAEGVFPFASWYLWMVYSDNLYWQEGASYEGNLRVAMLDPSGNIAYFPLGSGNPISVVDGYLYYGQAGAVWRVPLSAARGR